MHGFYKLRILRERTARQQQGQQGEEYPMLGDVRVRLHIIRTVRIKNVGKSQSCMVSTV